METSGSMEVFWLLGAAFVGLGIYLYLYSRKRRRLVWDFARERGYMYMPGGIAGLEDRINAILEYGVPGVVRSFGQIRDVVEGNGITIFRGTELFDLSPHGKSQNTHFGRIATFCEVPVSSDLFVFFPKEGGHHDRHPGKVAPEDDPVFKKLNAAIQESILPHPLSVTLRQGKALLYFEPVLARETIDDLETLFELTEEVRGQLS